MSYTNLVCHIVFGTKGRRNSIPEAFEEDLYQYIGGIIRNKNGHQIEIGGTSNHIHILSSLHPTHSISEVVRDIKANSSRFMKDEIATIDTFNWQSEFGAFSVSESNVQDVRTYIQNQKQHHRGMTFQDEFKRLLDNHGIDYDEEFLWSD